MEFSNILRRAQKVISDNSPTILTSIAVTGTLTTVYFTGKASFKAAEVLASEKEARLIRNASAPKSGQPIEPEPDLKAQVQTLWKLYLPAAGALVGTITCVIFANRIGSRRAAALATAYSLAQRGWDDYKDKVVEKLGEKKEQELRDELAQERVDRNPVSQATVIVGNGGILCYEAYTGRYFMSSMEDLKSAQNEINYKVNHNLYASLSDFYDAIGLPKTDISDEFGWNANEQLELEFTTVLSDQKEPALSFMYRVMPIRHFDRLC